eukprot:gene55966-74724_t
MFLRQQDAVTLTPDCPQQSRQGDHVSTRDRLLRRQPDRRQNVTPSVFLDNSRAAAETHRSSSSRRPLRSQLLPTSIRSVMSAPVAARASKPTHQRLAVTEGIAGMMVTIPGVVAAFAAILVTVGVGKSDRRHVILGLTALLAISNLIVALSH